MCHDSTSGLHLTARVLTAFWFGKCHTLAPHVLFLSPRCDGHLFFMPMVIWGCWALRLSEGQNASTLWPRVATLGKTAVILFK